MVVFFRESHDKNNLVCNAYFPKCEYFHGQWQDNSDRSSALIEFGSRIEHISIWSGRTWTDFKITIGEGAVCDIQIGAFSTLTESSLHNFAAKLGDNTANPTKAIQVGAANIAKLSDEEKAILVAKNYSLS